jgi:UDP:flavonoid glycosyltransferase YjiC (YdhE family)
MARFLFATMAVPGHVAPIAPVVRTLVERGHEVTWYTSVSFADEVRAAGASLAPIKSAIDFGDADYDRHFPDRAKYEGLRQVVFDFEHIFVGSVEGYVTDLRELIASLHPAALVIDPAVAAGAILSMVDGVPTAIINVSVLALEDPAIPPFGMGLPPGLSLAGRLRTKLAYLFVDHVIFARVNRAFRAICKKHGWPTFPFRPYATRWLYLQPSVEAVEYPRATLPPQLHYIGPLLPERSQDQQLPSWWGDIKAAKAAGIPVVLVTQGTIATDPSELISPTLRALEFEDVLVVAAGVEPTGPESLPPNGRAAAFIPFVPLMPLVDAYVTNGGFGGVVIALANGVPIVSAGTTEDKAEVGGRIAYTGVGVNLKTSRPTEEQIRRAVFSVLRDPRYRDRAQAIQQDFATHNAPLEAAQLIEQLAATQTPVIRD